MRVRYLDTDEVARLMDVLETYERYFALYFVAVLFTGSRKMEVCAMRWDQIQLDQGLWRRVQKGGRVAATVLSDELVSMLIEWKADQDADPGVQGTPWVFPAPKAKSGHLMEPCMRWRKICKLAGITGATIHTLRHTHATGKQLGHQQLSTTERYTHFSVLAVRDWVNDVTRRMRDSGKRNAAGDI